MTYPHHTQSPHLSVVNPLPRALRHYAEAILAMFPGAVVHDRLGIEGRSGVTRALLALIVPITRLLARYPAGDVLVIWPAFGYWDTVTWWWTARRRTVHIVMHDISPLRRQFGYTTRAHRAFARSVRSSKIRVLCHTQGAADELRELTGISADVLPHPIAEGTVEAPERTTVRVLGQYKEARSLDALTAIASEAPGFVLEVHGRGWPDVEGWSVRDEFIPEEEFAHLVATATCIVLPYSRLYQSGVAVRGLESGTPVVAPHHEQISLLFGENWPGTVEDEDWAAAVRRASEVPRSAVLALRDRAISQARLEWISHFDRVGPTQPN